MSTQCRQLRLHKLNNSCWNDTHFQTFDNIWPCLYSAVLRILLCKTQPCNIHDHSQSDLSCGKMHRYLWWCIVRIYLEGVLVCNIFLLLYCIASPPRYDTVLVENDPLDILPIYGNFKVKRKMTVKQSYFMTNIWGKRRRRTVKFEPRSEIKKEAIYVVLEVGKRTNSESHKESNPRSSDFALRCSASQLQKKPYDALGHKRTRVLQTIIMTLQWSTYESNWYHQSASIQVDLVLWFCAAALQQLASSSK